MAVQRGFLLYLCIYLACVHSNEIDDGDDLQLAVEDTDLEPETKLFEPTTEWKRISDDETIPPGLHVRINLRTGEKEAKLLQDSEQEGDESSNVDALSSAEEPAVQGVPYKDIRRANHLGSSDRVGIVNKKSVAFTKEQLRESLKEQKQDTLHFLPHIPNGSPSMGMDSGNEPAVSEWSKEEDEVMDRFGEKFLTKEHRAMLEHFDVLARSNATLDDLTHSMQELEYFVHQIDNGEFFATVGGLSLVMKFLNHTSTVIRSMAAQVIGSAAQSNPVVQQQALVLGCLNSLLPSLHPSGDPESDTLQRRALFAISAILRHNRDAQQHFIVTLDGLHVVGRDLQDRSTKYQIKALVFLTDMLNELEGEDASSEQTTLRPILLNTVSDSVWCRVMVSLLLHPDLDHQQKAIEGMQACADVCSFVGATQILEVRLKQWDMHDHTDSYWASLQNTARELLTAIRQQNKEL